MLKSGQMRPRRPTCRHLRLVASTSKRSTLWTSHSPSMTSQAPHLVIKWRPQLEVPVHPTTLVVPQASNLWAHRQWAELAALSVTIAHMVALALLLPRAAMVTKWTQMRKIRGPQTSKCLTHPVSRWSSQRTHHIMRARLKSSSPTRTVKRWSWMPRRLNSKDSWWTLLFASLSMRKIIVCPTITMQEVVAKKTLYTISSRPRKSLYGPKLTIKNPRITWLRCRLLTQMVAKSLVAVVWSQHRQINATWRSQTPISTRLVRPCTARKMLSS